MENSINYSVLIIGAGPAGLILGYYLEKANIDYLILEQGGEVGHSWSQMPDHLHLITMWHSNCLIKEDLPLAPRYKTHSAKEFAAYLLQFSMRHKLKLKNHSQVLEIKKENDVFVVQTQNVRFLAKTVVDCRGYFNSPFIPDLAISGGPPLMVHFKDYKNSAQFSAYKNILVVGKRLSAGQILLELEKTGRHELYLSVRSKIRYSPKPFMLNFFLKHLNLFEGLATLLKPNNKFEAEVPMHFAVKRIVEEQTKVVGDIVKIVDKKVTFTCGDTQEIDAIIFATGFRPASVFLRDDFESKEVDGLYYLGRGSQRTFSSRFIRGIRADAPILCQLILGRLASSNKFQ